LPRLYEEVLMEGEKRRKGEKVKRGKGEGEKR
jgi:hypothetical protein